MESRCKQQNRCKQRINGMNRKEGTVLQVAIVRWTKCGKSLCWRRYLMLLDRFIQGKMSVINVSNEDRDFFFWNFASRLAARRNSVTHRPPSKKDIEHILCLVCLCEFVSERCGYLSTCFGKPFALLLILEQFEYLHCLRKGTSLLKNN